MIFMSLNVAQMCISISNNCCYYVGQQTKQSESIYKKNRKKSSLAWLELESNSSDFSSRLLPSHSQTSAAVSRNQILGRENLEDGLSIYIEKTENLETCLGSNCQQEVETEQKSDLSGDYLKVVSSNSSCLEALAG